MPFANNQQEPNSTNVVGKLRFLSDMRQLGGLLMITGFCAIVQPIGGVVDLIKPDGGTVTEGLPFASLFGSLCLVTIGFISILVGYSQVVHDRGNKWLTLALIILTQTAFIPYLTDMTSIGMAATAEGSKAFFNMFNPNDVSSMDVKFVGAMGIVAVNAYGFAFVGSISFMQFALHAYQTNKPQDRAASYYRGRLTFYSYMLLLAGAVQLFLGAYLLGNFATGSGGRFEESILSKVNGTHPFVSVAMFTVNIPALTVFVGSIQVFNAMWGLARSYGLMLNDALSPNTQVTWFQVSMYTGWVIQILFQGVVQIGIQGAIPAAAGLVGVSFGLNLMPAFLDYKSRTVPEVIEPEEYYGLTLLKEVITDKQEQATILEDGFETIEV